MARMLVCCLLLFISVAGAQVRSISTTGDGTVGLSSRMSARNIRAIGGGAEVRFHLFGDVLLGVKGGYAFFALDQPDQLNRWNWRFWNERYYPKIQADMKADPNLKSVINSVQGMDLLPVSLCLEYEFAVNDAVRLIPAVGGGVAFFTRTLYADETWTKAFPQADYTLTYNLRNFAPDKNGRSAFIDVGGSAEYHVATGVSLVAGATYREYVSVLSGDGEFPLISSVALNLGLIFHY